MLKVIIVDDEKRIVEMIRRLIDWDSLGFEVADVAYNGPDAFALVEKLRPDVVIADVRMPGYDGIELIRRCHDAEHYPNFIIVSGYRFFEYAHNALRYGVEHYLLKPLDKQELTRALEIIRKKRHSELERENHEHEALTKLDESADSLRRRFVVDCLSPETMPKSAEEADLIYRTSFAEGPELVFTSVCVKLYSVSGARVDIKPVLNRICADFPKFFSGVCLEHVEAVHENHIISVLNCPESRLSALDEAVEQFFASLKQMTEMFGHFETVAGIGEETKLFSDIPRCISTAVTASLYRLDVDAQLIRYGAYSYTSMPVLKFFTPEIERLFIDAVASNETENIRKYYRGCLSRIDAVPHRCPSMIYGFMHAVRDCIQRYIDESRLDRTAIDPKLLRFDEALEHRCTESELTEAVLLIVMEISELISHQRYLEYSKPIRTARKYIDEHYMEQISLEELAEMVHLSSSYLSTVFKDETGLGFSDYLINCRISAAKELLRKTDKTLPEIAEAIGYKDSKHFGKLFKKITGIKPTDFRKLYS